jgi:hypothetical protein
MPNVNSNGKFGTSMDSSQLIEIRRKYAGVRMMTINNSTNSPNAKPRFNQDKFNREPATNGATDFYFARGLNTVFSRIGAAK